MEQFCLTMQGMNKIYGSVAALKGWIFPSDPEKFTHYRRERRGEIHPAEYPLRRSRRRFRGNHR